MISMRAPSVRALFLTLLSTTLAPAQVLSNSSLTAKYFARHVEFATDANNNVTDARSIIGAMTFDALADIMIAILAATGTVKPAPVWQGGIRVDSSGTAIATSDRRR
jgi:hypothetical protein